VEDFLASFSSLPSHLWAQRDKWGIRAAGSAGPCKSVVCAASSLHQMCDDGSCRAGEATMLPDEADKHINLNVGMKMASRYIADQMLEQRHLKVLHKTLSTAWNRTGQVQSLSAAIALMEQYGVELTDEEVQRIASMEQEQQIAALVNKMPQESNEQFQQFFLQLQLLVSTAMRVRSGLEDGAPEKVASALDDADSTGVTQHILRMAVVQAGSEASMQMLEYEAWVREADEQMARLIRGQEDAMAARKKLATLQAQLQHQRDEHKEKSSKVLQVDKPVQVCMNFVSGMTQQTKLACFQGWLSCARRAKQEGSIAREFEEQLDGIQQRLVDYRQSSLANVRSYLAKKAAVKEVDLTAEVLNLWYTVVADQRETDALAGQVDELSSKLASTQGAQKETTKRVMERMSAARDRSLLGQCVQCWLAEVEDSKKQGMMHDVLADAKARLQSFLKGKSESSMKVLKMALGGTDTGLLTQALGCWKSQVLDLKKEAELERLVQANAKQMADYGDKRKAVAKAAMERVQYYSEQSLLMETFHNWRLDTKVEVTLQKYHIRIEAKRQQLAGVHQMFRTFAHQLETSLKKSVDSERASTLRRTRTLHKADTGTVSLPDIHKPGSPSGDPIKAEATLPRTAWG